MAKVKNRFLVEGCILTVLTLVFIGVPVSSRNPIDKLDELFRSGHPNDSFADPSLSEKSSPTSDFRPKSNRPGVSIADPLRTRLLSTGPTSGSTSDTFCDFETPCSWEGKDTGYQVVTGWRIKPPGPRRDADGKINGHFLYLYGDQNTVHKTHLVYSERFQKTEKSCRLIFQFHGNNINESKIVIVAEGDKTESIEIETVHDVANSSWIEVSVFVGVRTKPFRIAIEVLKGDRFPYHAALDNIALEKCFPNDTKHNVCSEVGRLQCEPGVCVDHTRVCDITKNCKNGADETQRCYELAKWKAYCDFEHDMCGWTNEKNDEYEWEHQNSINEPTDHTYKNSSGHYMLIVVKGKKTTLGHSGILSSAIYPPPPRGHRDPHSPYYNKCQFRFHYRAPGMRKFEFKVDCVEVRPHGVERAITMWREFRNQPTWQRVVETLPHVKFRYKIKFLASVGLRGIEHLAVDDVSLSPECFGIDLPPSSNDSLLSRFEFGTCGAVGRNGPSEEECRNVYSNSGLAVQVAADGPLAGIQQWIVPKSGFYSVFARGASGGLGLNNQRPSKGATARGIFNWTQGTTIYILVGQEGQSSFLANGSTKALNPSENPQIGGGGGGGATYVFSATGLSTDNGNDAKDFILHLVAAGGGGLSCNMKEQGLDPDGRGGNIDASINGRSSLDGAGGGGGWKGMTQGKTSGKSLLEGAVGGDSCVKDGNNVGGFGGGGGGCISGGGGGGYAGGDAALNNSSDENGLGGYSYASGLYSLTQSGKWEGSGSVVIVPSLASCDCDHLCILLDLDNISYVCACEPGHRLDDDNSTCLKDEREGPSLEDHLIIVAVLVTAVFFLGVATFMFFLYQRFRRQMAQSTRQEQVNNPELQLNRLRQATGGMITEYNPNYEFGGSACTLQDLKEVLRENLTLIKALGQGAFGEVYQGLLSNLPGEVGDVPVAIKTLPELSASQSEMDFLMEALIMSKFSHPNIVRFIGVCFEKLPKFIVLELLPGGDLKSFLRESRPKPDKPSPLTTLDLLMLALDVAKGCHYLEQNHFIHRDMAARNCLLTTKDINRKVKIADFGMARDIYRADYYRKGGKAMLPVKWMPPEAFLDGIFTSKTDVWSFGVLLWEVMSLGYMPYPGRGNQDVMQLVTSGGRLEPPNNCPQPIYHIMSHCWHPVPEERPNFATILERLGYCLQDPDVLNAPLPVFHRPPSTERDATVMRPPVEMDNVCLQVQRGDTEPQSPASTDYLIPIPSSNYSLCTEKTELQSVSSMESVDRLLEMNNKRGLMSPDSVPSPLKPQVALPTAPINSRSSNNWETSFIQDLKEEPPAWSNDYQSTDPPHGSGSAPVPPPSGSTTMATIPPPESSPARRSPPSAIARQRPSVKNPIATSISPPTTSTSGLITLDRSALSSATEPEAVTTGSSKPVVVAAATTNVPLPLDASVLTKQHQQVQPVPYANVAMASAGQQSSSDFSQRTTGSYQAPHNEPYTITAPRGAAPPSNKGKYDRDVKC